MTRTAFFVCWLCLVTASAKAFSIHKTSDSRRLAVSSALSSSVSESNVPSTTQGRRSFLAQLTLIPAMATLLPSLAEPANASGGATAGGAYLLSAKQRYNERVKASVQGLLSSVEALKNGDSKPAKEYFEGEEGGTWKDLTAAGYLLSNAFRRNSTAAPDSLPSVKV
jgi:hypothetical protein